jgi:hypothetical protein
MSEPPPGLVLMTYSTGRVGAVPLIAKGRNSPAGLAAAGLAAGEAAAGAGLAAAAGLAAGEAPAGLAAGEAAAGWVGLLSAAGAPVGVGADGFGGVGAPPPQATVNVDARTKGATLDNHGDRLIAIQDLLGSR